jgi:hypothetical protein
MQTGVTKVAYFHGKPSDTYEVVEEAGIPGENHRPRVSNW